MTPLCYSTWAAFIPKVELQQDLSASYLFGGMISERSGRQEKRNRNEERATIRMHLLSWPP